MMNPSEANTGFAPKEFVQQKLGNAAALQYRERGWVSGWFWERSLFYPKSWLNPHAWFATCRMCNITYAVRLPVKSLDIEQTLVAASACPHIKNGDSQPPDDL